MSNPPEYGSVIYDGVDLAGLEYGLRLTSLPSPFFAKPKLDVQPVAHGGGISQGVSYEPLIIEVEGIVVGDDGEDLRGKVEAISDVLNVDSDRTLVLNVSGWSDKRWWARLNRGGSPTLVGVRGARFRLEFIAADPIGESTVELSESYTPDSDSFTFYIPDDAGSVVGGNYKAVPVYTLTAVGDNPAGLAVENVSRGQEITYLPQLLNTQKLKIDSKNFTVQKSTDGGSSWVDVISNCDSGAFPELTRGLRNQMLLTNGDNTTVAVDYRERYLGG